MDFTQAISENEQQILLARERRYIRDLDAGTFDVLRAHGKYMIGFCSDGRYSQRLIQYITATTGAERPHKYCGHGGALLFKQQTPLMPADSTYARDTVNMIKYAHEKLGYQVLVASFHGPECKAMLEANVSFDQAFSLIDETMRELNLEMPGLLILPMFHRATKNGECRLYSVCIDTYREHMAQKHRPQPTAEDKDIRGYIPDSIRRLAQQFPQQARIVDVGFPPLSVYS